MANPGAAMALQGRRTFEWIDAWLASFVSSAPLRTIVMVVGLLLVHVVLIAIVAGLVELLTWLLG